MIARTILAAAVLQLAASAQLQLFHFDGTNDIPIASLYDAGTAATCDKLVIRFRVKNAGTAAANILINVAGSAGFTYSVNGLNPSLVPSQQELEFDVAFTPAANLTYSATITANSLTAAANSLSATLRATGIAAPCVSFAAAPLSAGGTADFGNANSGASVSKTFTLTNPSSSAPLTVNTISVSGQEFQGPAGLTMPLQIPAGGSVPVQVVFAPTVTGPATGMLIIDQRVFNLKGLGTISPLPKGTIVISSSAAASGQQVNVSVTLASASQSAGSGTLNMQFQPANGMPDDAAVEFLSGPKRNATVTISPGESIGRFNGQTNFAFQTGTTAGTIVLTLTLPNSSDQFTLTIVPATVNFSTTSGVHRIDAVDLNIAGFDNSHSVSQLGFTFYDTTGQAIPPGLIRVDATGEFKSYFMANPAYGGLFTMLATFPVTGDSSKIAAVDVQVSNTAGVATTQRITIN